MQPLLPRSLREGSNGVQALPGLSKGSSSSLCVPWHWAVPAALQGQSIPGQGWQGPGPASPPCSATTACLVCPEHESAQHHLHRVCQRQRHWERLQSQLRHRGGEHGALLSGSYHTQTPPLGHPCGAEVLGDTARAAPRLWGSREVFAQDPLGNGCKVLNSCRPGMSQDVRGPHEPSLAEGWGLSPHLCWGTSAPCLGDTGWCLLLR